MIQTKVGTAVVIIKPDAMARSLDLRIEYIIRKRKGLTVKPAAERFLLREEVQFLYRHLLDLPNYMEIEGFMVAAPVKIFSVTGPDAPERMESLKFAIRKLYRTDRKYFPEFQNNTENLIHSGFHPGELLILLRPAD